MKKGICLCLALCLVLLVGCKREPITPVSGNYYAQGDYEPYMTPYVYINLEDNSFVTGGGAALSYAEVGEFKMEDNRIIATTLSCRFVFEIENETTLKLVEADTHSPYEVTEDMTFVFHENIR